MLVVVVVVVVVVGQISTNAVGIAQIKFRPW
jgi:hypothetical protein